MRVGGRVVIPRGLDLERGRLRQRFGGRLPSPMRHVPRAGGREGSRPTELELEKGALALAIRGRGCRPRGGLDLEQVGGWGSSRQTDPVIP